MRRRVITSLPLRHHPYGLLREGSPRSRPPSVRSAPQPAGIPTLLCISRAVPLGETPLRLKIMRSSYLLLALTAHRRSSIDEAQQYCHYLVRPHHRLQIKDTMLLRAATLRISAQTMRDLRKATPSLVI